MGYPEQPPDQFKRTPKRTKAKPWKYLTCDHCEASFRVQAGGTVPIHRYQGSICPGGPKPAPLWAAFAGSALESGITLHLTEREALEAVINVLGLDFGSEEYSRGQLSDHDNESLRNQLEDYCSDRADDWCVQEVEIP